MRDFFRDPRCSCATAAELLLAALEHREPALCELHQADEVAARRRDHDRADAVVERDRLRDAVDEVRATDRLRAQDRARADEDTAQAAALAEIEQHDPLVARLVTLTGGDARAALAQLRPQVPAPSTVVPIGDDAAIKRIVTDAFGITDGGDPLPPAA